MFYSNVSRFWFFAALAGCGPAVDAGVEGTSETSPASSSSEGDLATNTTTGAPTPTTTPTPMSTGTTDAATSTMGSASGSEDVEGSTTGCTGNFLDDPCSAGCKNPPERCDQGPCDVWEQDCAEGEKCTVWANDGGNAWNATRCVPVTPTRTQRASPAPSKAAA